MQNHRLYAVGRPGSAKDPSKKRTTVPPTEVQCGVCGHWKHPRAAKCKTEGCTCECLKGFKGIKKKRQHAAIEAADGDWNPAQHRRVIHQAKFAAECMSKSRAVYAVLVAHRTPSGAVTSDVWGSEPWVENELAGKTGALEIIFKGKAAQYLSKEVSEGVGDYEPVMEALRRYGLAHFGAQFRADGVDAAAFRSLGEAHLTRLGITSVGDRIKVLEAAREMRDEEVARTAAAEGARAAQHAQLLAGLGGAQPGAPTGV